MPNLMLTTACNLRCEYCFAMEMLASGPVNMEMPLFLAIMDWIDRGHMPDLTIQLMGGEPTLSPHFYEIVEELTRRKRHVIVFSNGTQPLDERIVDQSKTIGVDWVININRPESYSRQQQETLNTNLAVLGECVSLNVNFFSIDHSFDFVFDYFARFPLKRLMKIGIAHPVATKKNSYIAPDSWPQLLVILDDFFAKAQQKNIRLATECGVPTCLFANLQQKYPGVLHQDDVSHCGSRLDIAPDGRLINCLPLSTVAAVGYDSFADYARASLWFHEFLTPFRALAWVDESCDSCGEIERGACRICLAHSINEFSHLPIPGMPEKDDEESRP